MCPLEQLYDAAGSRRLDQIAITGGQPGIDLMRRAGRAVFDDIIGHWPGLRQLIVCCGKGNNAGDGYVVAELARQAGVKVRLLQVGEASDLSGDAALARDDALRAGVTIERTRDGEVALDGDLIVDALLGTGLNGAPRSAYATLIDAMNASPAPVIAVDIPSGVSADTGAAPGAAIHAERTVTFIGRKIGLHTGAGVVHAGTVQFEDLGVGADVHRQVAGVDWLTFREACEAMPLPRRDAGAYKHALGHLVVVGGDRAMGGAPLMAAEAALRVGVGMVSVLTRAEHRSAMLSRRPELMVVDADDVDARADLIARASAFAVGPGLGRAPWGLELLKTVLAANRPTVIDADGLNQLRAAALDPPVGTVVTPHAAEAAALLGTPLTAVQADRLASVEALAERIQGVALIKGAGTVLAASGPSEPTRHLGICAHGNAGMATAGMGDVLTGMIAGLRAQGAAPATAAVIGTCLHSLAADKAADVIGRRALLATDLLEPAAALLKQLDDALS